MDSNEENEESPNSENTRSRVSNLRNKAQNEAEIPPEVERNASENIQGWNNMTRRQKIIAASMLVAGLSTVAISAAFLAPTLASYAGGTYAMANIFGAGAFGTYNFPLLAAMGSKGVTVAALTAFHTKAAVIGGSLFTAGSLAVADGLRKIKSNKPKK